MLTDYDAIGPIPTADPVNRNHPLHRGRVAWWMTLPGLDGGNTIYDLAGQNHIRLSSSWSGRAWANIPRTGGFGCFDLGSYNGALALMPGNMPGPTVVGPPISLLAWVRPTALGAYRWAIEENSAHGGIGIGGAAGSPLAYWWEGSSDEYNFNSGLFLAVNEWALIAVVITPTNATVYRVNPTGLSSAVNTKTHTTHTTGGWAFASNPSSTSQFWSGQLDDLSVYNRALSAAEVRQYYDLSRTGYPGMLNRWSQRSVDSATAAVGGVVSGGLSIGAGRMVIGI
jgi:hypothetical protein